MQRKRFPYPVLLLTGLLGLALTSDGRIDLLGRVLSSGWLRYIGKVSYGIYLLHYPIFVLWARFLRTETFHRTDVARNLLAFAGQMALAIVVAAISWRLFEQPILRLKERFPSGSTMHWPEAEESKSWSRAVVTDSRV